MTPALQPGSGLMRDLTTITVGGRDERDNIFEESAENYKERGKERVGK